MTMIVHELSAKVGKRQPGGSHFSFPPGMLIIIRMMIRIVYSRLCWRYGVCQQRCGIIRSKGRLDIIVRIDEIQHESLLAIWSADSIQTGEGLYCADTFQPFQNIYCTRLGLIETGLILVSDQKHLIGMLVLSQFRDIPWAIVAALCLSARLEYETTFVNSD